MGLWEAYSGNGERPSLASDHISPGVLQKGLVGTGEGQDGRGKHRNSRKRPSHRADHNSHREDVLDLLVAQGQTVKDDLFPSADPGTGIRTIQPAPHGESHVPRVHLYHPVHLF